MDPLSQIIGLLRPREPFWRVVEAHGGWSIRFEPANVVVFGQMLMGTATMLRNDGIELPLDTGDFLLMIDPPHWHMRVGDGDVAIDYKSVVADPTRLLSADRSAAVTKFIAGNFSFATASWELLRTLMRPIIRIKSDDAASPRLGSLLAALGEEVLEDRPARSFVVEHLLELILVEALRHHDLGLNATSSGLVAGLQDPKIGKALKLVHQDAKRAWSVAGLARAVGLSRSAFAMRFAEIVGMPPIDYINRWRMLLAKDALATSDLSMAAIAEMIGFQSVSAFSTSFKREIGSPPSAYRKELLG